MTSATTSMLVHDKEVGNIARRRKSTVDSIEWFRPTGIRTLLVPLDGSPFAERVLPLAVEIARQSGAELRIVHVDSTLAQGYAHGGPPRDSLVRYYLAQLRWNKGTYIERIANQIRNESLIRVTANLLDHSNVSAGISEAVTADVDLVVMAAHGKGPIRRWVSGSTVHELLRRLPVPMIVVGSDGSFADPAARRVKRILVALDGSRHAERALGPALAVGEAAEAEFSLLRVVSLPSVLGTTSRRYPGDDLAVAPGKVRLAAARWYLNKVAKRMPQPCLVDSRVVLNEWSIARSIAAHAGAYGADLIAVATRKQAGRKRWRASIVDRVVQFARVPVLVAPA